MTSAPIKPCVDGTPCGPCEAVPYVLGGIVALVLFAVFVVPPLLSAARSALRSLSAWRGRPRPERPAPEPARRPVAEST